MSSPARPTRPKASVHPAALREAARRRLVTRILIGVGSTILVVLIELVVSRRVMLASPKHALVSIGNAFRDHDGTRLAYYADIDAIASQVADEGVDWLVAQHRRSLLAALRGEVHDIGTAPDSAQRVQLLKFALAEKGGQGVAGALAAGTADSANISQRLSEAFQSLPPLDLLMGGDHLDYVATGRPRRVGAGSVIPVTLEYRELGEAITVQLALSHQDKRWKVVGLEDVDEMLSAIDNAQLARVSSVNRPVQMRIEGMLELGSPKVTLVPVGRTDLEERLMVPVHNTSRSTIRQVTLLLGTRGGDEEHTDPLVSPVSIGPGASVAITWTFPETRRGTSRSAWLASRQDRMTLVPRGVVFDSAGVTDTLRLYHSYAEVSSWGRGKAVGDSVDSAP
ncbi:MAG TPA: hypothetical protein VNW46_01935 [Gemmatimonadaceae bacterium]|nr:hypothetical protein [Gemmatimonadaceae bacterium]